MIPIYLQDKYYTKKINIFIYFAIFATFYFLSASPFQKLNFAIWILRLPRQITSVIYRMRYVDMSLNFKGMHWT